MQVTVPFSEIRYRLCIDCLSHWAAIFEDFLTTSIGVWAARKFVAEDEAADDPLTPPQGREEETG